MKTSFDMEMKLTANSSSRVVLPSALAGKKVLYRIYYVAPASEN
jgi:hypothetical protein